MTPREGIRKLEALLKESRMNSEDLEEAIRIAGKNAPSSAFKRASTYWQLQHGRGIYYLAFAKGTRWLAMLRRDEGQQAFNSAVENLRKIAKGV